MQMRPKAILRILFGKDRHVRKGMRWYTRMGRRVWMREIVEFVLSERIKKSSLTLRSFWGASVAEHEESMVKRKRPVIPIKAA